MQSDSVRCSEKVRPSGHQDQFSDSDQALKADSSVQALKASDTDQNSVQYRFRVQVRSKPSSVSESETRSVQFKCISIKKFKSSRSVYNISQAEAVFQLTIL